MVLGSVRDVWPTLAIVPVYLGIVHFGQYSSQVVHPDFATLMRFIWIGWNRGFLTATVGLQYGSAGIVTANILVFALVLWSASRNPANVILWGGFAAYFVISICVVGWNRAVPFGLESAEIARYGLFVRLFGWHGRVVTEQDATSAFDQDGNLARRP